MKQRIWLRDKLWAYESLWKDSGASGVEIHHTEWVQHFPITWSLITGVEPFLLNLAVSVPGCDPVVPDLESALYCLWLYNISTSGFYGYCPAPDVGW